MFLTHAHNKIQAIEAATGELIWEYQYEFPPASKMLGGPTRNIALWQDRLFLATYDAAIVAIDAQPDSNSGAPRKPTIARPLPTARDPLWPTVSS